MNKLKPPFKIQGGKFYLSEWIVENFPENYEQMDYIEPYAGACSVFLRKNRPNPDCQEILNDIDVGIVKILRTLRDEGDEFVKKLKNITYSERVFSRELKKQDSTFETDFDWAVNEFIVRRMSRGGLKKSFSDRTGSQSDTWKNAVGDVLPKIIERFNKTFIFNEKPIDIITAFSGKNVLAYVDPPDVVENATEPEMSTDDHIALSQALLKFQGKVVLSGYPSTLYKRLYKDWRCIKKKITSNANQKKSIKMEMLWMNY